MGPALRIGLTGGIASGKSTAAQRFVELGVPVIDADQIAREVVAPGEPGLAAVLARFGPEVLDSQGRLNRGALRARVFSDPLARRDLEALLHPLIRARMQSLAAAALGPYVVLAIPLLIEGGGLDRVDRVLVVDTDEAAQVERLMARDAGTREQALAILATQATREQRLRAAHDVLPNTRGVRELRQAVDALHRSYLRLAGRDSPP